MSIADPRERYDDLVVTESRERLEPEEFSEAANSEAARIGWVILGFVLDAEDRILMVEEPWADGWLAPGGVPKPDETLAEAVVREVREETGIEATPVRPHAVEEFTAVNERTGETLGWTTTSVEAVAETAAIDPNPGVEDEEIIDVRWFDGLPEAVFNRELTEAVYRRCRGDGPHSDPG